MGCATDWVGMSQNDIAQLVEAGFSKMNLHGGALTLVGPSAALPHGTLQPRQSVGATPVS